MLKEKRQTNIELLRIFAALSVILLHYNNASLGGGFYYVDEGSKNQFLMCLLEVICICAVNIYVLISGYFMKDSMKRNLMKPVKLLLQFLIFESIFFVVNEFIILGSKFSIRLFISLK